MQRLQILRLQEDIGAVQNFASKPLQPYACLLLRLFCHFRILIFMAFKLLFTVVLFFLNQIAHSLDEFELLMLTERDYKNVSKYNSWIAIYVNL